MFGGNSGPLNNNRKNLQLYSLSKLVTDVTSKSVTGGGASGKNPIIRSKEVNNVKAACTKTTMSIKRTIPTAREMPKKEGRIDSQRHLHILRANEARAHDYWERFRDSKLEKMRQHKLNVEQRMRDNDKGDNYNYYWDNINHCYSNQSHPKLRAVQANRGNEEQALPASWYTDNIYSNWSIDLDDEDFQRRCRTAMEQRRHNQRTLPRDATEQPHFFQRCTRPRSLRNLNSGDINGNLPTNNRHSLHGFDFEEQDSVSVDGDLYSTTYNYNNELRVEDFRMDLKPTTPTKYGHLDRSGRCVFGNNHTNGSAAEESDLDELAKMANCRSCRRRTIPKSKSFGHETEDRRGGGGGGRGNSSFFPRSKTTNLLMDIQSKFRRSFGRSDDFEDNPPDNGQRFSTVDNANQSAAAYCGCVHAASMAYDNNASRDDYQGGCGRLGCRPAVVDCPSAHYRPSYRTMNSMDEELLRRRSRFNFHKDLLLNSEDEDEDDGKSENLHIHRDLDQNNNPPLDPWEPSSYFHESLKRPPRRRRPSSLNLRGRSLDDYEYRGLDRMTNRNMNYIDKNLNIENFLNSARRIPQEYEEGMNPPSEIANEQIFNPNVEYRSTSSGGGGGRGTVGGGVKGKINRMRNYSSLDLEGKDDWEASLKGPQSILEKTTAIFGNLIHSPDSHTSVEGDRGMLGPSKEAIGRNDKIPYLNFISEPDPESMPIKSCMKKTAPPSRTDYIIHHPHQSLDYKLNNYYPQDEFNEPPLIACRHPSSPRPSVLGDDDDDDDLEDLEDHHHDLSHSFHVENNCGGLDKTNNLDKDSSAPPHFDSPSDEEILAPADHHLDSNTLHIINNIFSIYKPNQYSPVNCHNPTMDNVKDNYSKKISLPSTMRPLGESLVGPSDCYLLNDENNNILPNNAYDDCFIEAGPSAIMGNRRRKSTFFSSLKRPLMVVKSKSYHDSVVAASDDHWFCSGDLAGGAVSGDNYGNGLTSPTDSNNSLKTGLYKFSPTSTTTSYFYPFDYYFNGSAAHRNNNANNLYAGAKKTLKLKSTSRPLSFSH